MTISIIVAVYNQREYLGECVDSILTQTYTDIDVVLVDDGSTDGSAQMCDSYAEADPRVRVIHQPNQGVSATRNRGAEAARGQYLIFVDSDDTLHLHTVEYLVGIMLQKGAKAAIGHMSATPITARRLQGHVSAMSPRAAIAKTLYQEGIDNSLCGKLLPVHAVREAPEPVNLRFEDLDTFYRVYEHIDGDIAVSDAAVYYYRPHAQSFIHTYTPGRLHVLEVTDRIEQHFTGDPEIAPAAHDRKFSANYNIYILTSLHGDHQVARRCWQVVKAYRKTELINPRVRLKNKLGALASYLGGRAVLLLARIFKM